jgi:hypothetical protein
MSYQLPNTDVPLFIEFRSDGEFVIPDANTVRWTVRESSGVPVSGYNNVSVPGITTTQTTLTVLAASNVLPGGAEVLTRFVEVNFTLIGVPQVMRFDYKLHTWIPMTVVPADVRAVYGVREKELPDSDIDLLQAYLDLKGKYPTFGTFLTDTTGLAGYANRALALKAALNVLPSMPVRTMKEESLSNAGQIRATIDWEALGLKLQAQLDDLLETTLEVTSEYTVAPVFLLTNPTDVITNA